jgi:hypothetical protein
VCPLCGSAAFDSAESACPVCQESYKKYRAVETANIDLTELDNYTTIEIDGDEKILIDEDGNTSVVSIEQLEGSVTTHTHELFIGEEEEPLIIDSGMAVSQDEETEEDIEVAFFKLPLNIEEVVDLIQEENQDSVEVVPTEDGYHIIIKIESDEEVVEEHPLEEDTEEELDVAVESSHDEFTDVDVDTEEVPVDSDLFEDEFVPEDEGIEEYKQEKDTIIFSLEELAEGTVVHADKIKDIQLLIGIFNQLLPEEKEILQVEEDLSSELVDSDVEKLEDEVDTTIAEDLGDSGFEKFDEDLGDFDRELDDLDLSDEDLDLLDEEEEDEE